jgi:DNA-binding NtrC family response regulator
LRDRPEDIEPLVHHFAEQVTGIPGVNPLEETLPALRRHAWNGNIRELRNVVEAALAMGQLRLDDAYGVGPRESPSSPLLPYREARARAVAQFEIAYLTQAMFECRGNASEAARQAHMDRQYLLALLRKHGLR